ncbi:MAG: hypothetical protein HF312_02605 [Ignavibacteria bacterium]|jgi:predicted AAA+ superfamily ATPase|nr:hypothetical protein [Ignavibacteria bacterium]MCU7519076.1 hypothetical protein [Ignavibacteria bacterium]
MERHFVTQDFYLAAAAMAKNYDLVDYYREGGFTTFLFRETPELHQFIKEYYSELTTIEPVKHARAIKSLKSLCHSLSLSISKSTSNNELHNKKKGFN